MIFKMNGVRDAERWTRQNRGTFTVILEDKAVHWAECMEKRITEGKDTFGVSEVAEECLKKTLKGVVVTEYMAVIEYLVHFWAFGDDLRRWHNSKFLSKAQAGVVNKEGGLWVVAEKDYVGQKAG